ncbi:MAG: hypothetical protein NW206_00600, partial [Hyphomonadaceae bacterium]|nr:hypothetical protein [Hyphomonadaceae bacterium]
MTTITATDNFAGAFNDLVDVNNLAGMTGSAASTTSFTLSEVASPGPGDLGATRIVFNGLGFSSYTGNFANTGTIQVINVYEWDGDEWIGTANWTGMNVPAATLLAAIQNLDTAQGDADFLDAIFGGDDSLTGADSFEDGLLGYDGADLIRGLGGNDTVSGGAGADILYGDYGLDVVNGDAGNDTIYAYTSYDSGVDNLADTLDGGDDTDTLVAWGVNLAGGPSNVDLRQATLQNLEKISFVAQASNITAITLQMTAEQVLANFDTTGVVTGASTLNCLSALNIEQITTLDLRGWTFNNWETTDAVQLIGANTGSVIYANATTRSQLYGGTGADELYGSDLNDQFYSAANYTADGDIDNMYGGDGDDNYSVLEAGDIVHENANEGFDYAAVYVNNYVMVANLEAIGMYTGCLIATGNALGNSIQGDSNISTAKAETMYGLGGADDLYGHGGNDTLVGGAGADDLYGGDGLDTASYATAANAVNVNLTTGAAAGSDALGDTFDSIENLTGSNFNDKLTGNSSANRLSGGAGNDTLDGGLGNDNMIGGGGDDTYVVNAAGDVTNETSAAGGVDLVKSSVTRTLGANLENLTLTGAAVADATGNTLANVITGNSGVNALNGLEGADTIVGGGGGDTLNGGVGLDTLTGGAGADKFVLNAAAVAGNADTITDFTHNSDKIQLENSVFTALGAATG